jgi:hypothetical protein
MKERLLLGLATSLMVVWLSSQPGCAGQVITNADNNNESAGASGAGRTAARPDAGGTGGSLIASGGIGAQTALSTGGIDATGGLTGTGGTWSSLCFTLEIQAETVLAEAGACRFAVPNRPVDLRKININLVGNNIALLHEDDSCQSLGWRFDDPNSPMYIELCALTCESLTTDTLIQVVGGCGGPGVQ